MKAVIQGAVLWQGSRVRGRAVLKNCVVASNSSIQRDGYILDNCVVGDNVTVGGGNRLAQGARLWPKARSEPNTISEGRLRTRTWESQDGQRHYRTEVVAN